MGEPGPLERRLDPQAQLRPRIGAKHRNFQGIQKEI
jgi:hypothetical protein